MSFVEDRWSLGFIEEPLADVISGKPYLIHYVLGIPKDRWYADPFILDFNENTIELLVEEWRYKTSRGRIARLVIDRINYYLLESHIILELPTHLSFPFIYRVNGKVYILPENSESGQWKMYEYKRADDSVKEIKTVINEPLTDAVITEFEGEEYVFSTRQPNACGTVLTVYTIEGEIIQEIDLGSRIARGAGSFFTIEDIIYRPAQDCNGGYGKAVIIQKVDRGEDGLFVFDNVARITSSHKKFNVGCHTLNSYNGLSVIDVRGYRRRLLSVIIVSIKNMLKRLL